MWILLISHYQTNFVPKIITHFEITENLNHRKAMGWRYRKRIKILPGIHLNISKSGISANIGVKGANVTFGKNGTYVNTGIPGTGLYRRDKVSESGKKDYFEDVERINETEKNQAVYGSQNNQKGFGDNTFYLSFKPSHYIFYFLLYI